MMRFSVPCARSSRATAAFVIVAALLLPGSIHLADSETRMIELRHFDISPDCKEDLFQEWYADLWEVYGEGAIAPMKFVPSDEQLAKIGLPSRDIMLSTDFSTPKIVWEDGRIEPVALPSGMADSPSPTALVGDLPKSVPTSTDALMTYAGTGCLGIRPGSFLWTEEGALCSLAHVYGNPGSYKISTAGHCTEKRGEKMTAIAALGEGGGLLGIVLYEFGKTASTTGDGGIGNDKALIQIYDHAQDITSPTMCFWGGPRGTYEEEGALVTMDLSKSILPTFDLDPNYVQGIVHYGHGLALGTGGTPRAGIDQFWDDKYYAFYGAISPGDSGSGSNTALGEAAGINTHIILIDPPRIANTMGALMVGTRATIVGDVADGQIVPYPVPVTGLP